MTSNKVGSKIRAMRDHFDISQKQATALLDAGISHSAWAYWEGHGCPNDRLVDIANMTTTPDQTFDWLTSENGDMPTLTLNKPIPQGSGFSMPNKKKKKKSKRPTRRDYTPQDRANILAKVNEMRETHGLSIKDAMEKIGVWVGAFNKWQGTDLPAPNGAAVPGLFDESPAPAEEAQPASAHTNLPQQRVPKKSGVPAASDKLTPMAVLVMRYQCPRCGQNLSLEQE